MPYAIKRLPHSNLYRVYNLDTGKIYAKHTSKQRAEAQVRLLRMVSN